jgi:hypothetical protein
MHLTKKTWNVSDVKRQIDRIAMECKSPYNEGFTSFEMKKELYEIYFHLDKLLKSCPTFEGEQEWLQEKEKQAIIKHLKNQGE